MPATGHPVMLRTASPQPPTVVSPASFSLLRMSRKLSSRIQWSWTFWRVESSPSLRP
jgi:hypothetical protein